MAKPFEYSNCTEGDAGKYEFRAHHASSIPLIIEDFVQELRDLDPSLSTYTLEDVKKFCWRRSEAKTQNLIASLRKSQRALVAINELVATYNPTWSQLDSLKSFLSAFITHSSHIALFSEVEAHGLLSSILECIAEGKNPLSDVWVEYNLERRPGLNLPVAKLISEVQIDCAYKELLTHIAEMLSTRVLHWEVCISFIDDLTSGLEKAFSHPIVYHLDNIQYVQDILGDKDEKLKENAIVYQKWMYLDAWLPLYRAHAYPESMIYFSLKPDNQCRSTQGEALHCHKGTLKESTEGLVMDEHFLTAMATIAENTQKTPHIERNESGEIVRVGFSARDVYINQVLGDIFSAAVKVLEG